MNFKNVNKNQKRKLINVKESVKNNIPIVKKTKKKQIRNVGKILKNANVNVKDNFKSKRLRQNRPIFLERFSPEISRYLIWNLKLIRSFNSLHVKLTKSLLQKEKLRN